MSYSVAHPLSGKRELNLKAWQLFSLVSIANIILMFLFNEFIFTLDVYHNIFSDQMESTRIDEYFDFSRQSSIWGYLATPLFLLLNFTFISLLIQMPLVLMFIDIPFNRLFRLVILASILMLASGFIRFFFLATQYTTQITKSTLNIVPLSINHLLDASKYPELAYTTLGMFNIFEFGWCYVLYKGLSTTGKVRKETAALFIFLIWIFLLLFKWGLSAYFLGVEA